MATDDRFQKTEPPNSPSPIQCAQCGNEIRPGKKFCSRCGAPAQGPLSVPPRAEVDRMPPPPRAEVDRMPAPPPRALPPEFYRAPRGRVSPQQWIFALGGATLVLVVCACVALFALRGLPPTVSPTSPASNVIVLATSEPPKLLAPQEFAVTNQNLATAIANLNRVELKFVQDAQTAATNAATLDDDLREVAARAFIVAQTASALGLTAVAQDGGSDAAGQTAAQYYSIARLGYALVIEAQSLREGLPAFGMNRHQS